MGIRSTVDCCIRGLDRDIDTISTQVNSAIEPWRNEMDLLVTAPGVAERVAESIIAETTGDMSRFATARHLTSWAGLAPGNHESTGRSRPVATIHGNATIKTVMVEAAKAAVRTDGFLKARYHPIARRRGPNKATIAVARSLMIGIWHMLTNNKPWRDLGADYHHRRRDPHKQATRHLNQLKALGYEVTVTATP